MLAGVKRKYPNTDVDQILAGAQFSSTYLKGPVQHQLVFGGEVSRQVDCEKRCLRLPITPACRQAFAPMLLITCAILPRLAASVITTRLISSAIDPPKCRCIACALRRIPIPA